MKKEISGLGREVKESSTRNWGNTSCEARQIWRKHSLYLRQIKAALWTSASSSMKISIPSPPSKGCLEVISFNRLKWPLTECLAHSRQTVNISCSPPFCTKLNPVIQISLLQVSPAKYTRYLYRSQQDETEMVLHQVLNSDLLKISNSSLKSPPWEACDLARAETGLVGRDREAAVHSRCVPFPGYQENPAFMSLESGTHRM